MEWSIKGLLANVGISYVISWAFFFITLPLFVSFFGKVTGTALTYGVSWGIMLLVIYIFEKTNVDKKFLALFSKNQHTSEG